LRRSDLIRNNCSVIKGQIASSARSTFELKPRAAGNGIFGCGDRRQKAPIKYVMARGDKEYGKGPAENPRKKALFDLVLEMSGLRRLDGVGRRPSAMPRPIAPTGLGVSAFARPPVIGASNNPTNAAIEAPLTRRTVATPRCRTVDYPPRATAMPTSAPPTATIERPAAQGRSPL
jgi:hypothetical protein